MIPGDLQVRPVQRLDHDQWRPLWDGYNAFYGRIGPTALDEAVTQQTWDRFFLESDPVNAWVAVRGLQVLGLVHTVYHSSTTRLHKVSYLQDLFTLPAARGQGVGRALMEAAHTAALAAGCSRLYWFTHESNHTARRLYDQLTPYTGAIVYMKDL